MKERMTAATHTKFKFIAAMLVTLFVCVAFFASCADSTEAASSAESSVATSEVSESFVSDDASNESSAEVSDASEPESSTMSDTESSEDISNDGPESSEISEDPSDVSNEISEPTESGSSGTNAGGNDGEDESAPENETSSSQGSDTNGEDESSEPSEEDDTSNEDNASTDTSSDNGNSESTEEPKTVLYGDTPVIVDVNGVEYALTSYEEAAALIPFKAAEKGFTIVFKANTSNAGLVLISNGDGTYTSGSGTTFSATRVSNIFHNHWCRKCGLRSGDGTHGTCQVFTCDKDCPLCGEPCEKLACHTCDE